MKAIIVGGGNVGFYLAKTLTERGCEVSLIEKDKQQSRFCADNLDAEINCGDGTTVEALEASGAAAADILIAATGRDECNLVCCQIAKKQFGLQKTVCKVNNPKNTDVLKALGVDIVVSATDSIIRSIDREIDISQIKALIDLDEDGEASIYEINIPKRYPLEGKKLSDISLPEGCNIACIRRGGKMIVPRGNTTICGQDTLIVAAQKDSEKELRRALKIKD